ncbi:MAG: TrkA family potassium uptake protein [Lentisphaeria bacterium]|nr:TrkA family potassium uptake protein [Lentisphaeria bacterium]
MSKQIMIIGLGQFGMSLARTLAERGAEVLAVDISQEKVDAAAEFVSRAVAIDATDENALAGLLPAERDAVVCAMGDSSKEAAIICTALLRQMGCPRIIARAGSATCRRILFMVGAHEVIFPEQDYGQRFATWLMHRELLSCTDWNGELSLSEIKPPKFMIGKNLVELELPKKYGIIVAAVRRDGKLCRPDPELPVEPDDVLFIVSDESAIARLSEVR